MVLCGRVNRCGNRVSRLRHCTGCIPPQMCTGMNGLSVICRARSTNLSSTPRASNNSRVRGMIVPARDCTPPSRRSSTLTFTPARASSLATVSPDGPPPTTMTSMS